MFVFKVNDKSDARYARILVFFLIFKAFVLIELKVRPVFRSFQNSDRVTTLVVTERFLKSRRRSKMAATQT